MHYPVLLFHLLLHSISKSHLQWKSQRSRMSKQHMGENMSFWWNSVKQPLILIEFIVMESHPNCIYCLGRRPHKTTKANNGEDPSSSNKRKKNRNSLKQKNLRVVKNVYIIVSYMPENVQYFLTGLGKILDSYWHHCTREQIAGSHRKNSQLTQSFMDLKRDKVEIRGNRVRKHYFYYKHKEESGPK